MAKIARQLVFTGLGTFSTSVDDTGVYEIIASLTLPTKAKGASGDSAVVTVLKQNSTTMRTSPAGEEGFMFPLTCAAGDTIQIILSSAATVDQASNVIKGTVAIG